MRRNDTKRTNYFNGLNTMMRRRLTMIVTLLTFAVSGFVYAAHSLVSAARADKGALGTAVNAAKSIAAAVTASAPGFSQASVMKPAVIPVKPVAPNTAKRKACTLKA
jgi:hypothetical protein